MADHRKKLRAICIIAIVLGGLGFLSIVSELSGAALRRFRVGFPERAPRELREIQEEYETDLRELLEQWRASQISFLTGGVLVCTGLIIGGIQTLRNRKAGFRILTIALLLAIPIDLARNSLSLYLYYQASGIMVRFMERVMDVELRPGHQESNEAGDFVSGAMTVMYRIYSIFLIFWIVLKMCFYAISFRYLQKPGVDNLFTPPKPPPLPVQL